MVMHTIQVTYDPTTRRISLIGRDNYGGATTDVNSVSIEFTGIEAFGNDFIARVDFAVPIKKDDYTIEHPFILLEQDGNEWSTVIPNAVLMAAKETKKLPFQLILANDSQVINSRNAITLDITPGVDSLIPGSDLPEYEAPEWPLPEEITYTEEDVHTVEVTYDPVTRTLSTSSRDMYGGATIDTRSVRINVSGIVPIGDDFSARLDFAAPIRYDEGTVIKPFVVLEQINNTWCAMIPQAILMAVKETKKLPFQLVTRHGDTIINSRNAIVLEITRAINAMETVDQAYTPYVMYRNDSWQWLPEFTYKTGSVVTYNGTIYVSIADNNIGNVPSEDDVHWRELTIPPEAIVRVQYDLESCVLTVVTFEGVTTTYDLSRYVYFNGARTKVGDTIDFYAPVTSGNSNEALFSRGIDAAPVWVKIMRKVPSLDFTQTQQKTVALYPGETTDTHISVTLEAVSSVSTRILYPGFAIESDGMLHIKCNVPGIYDAHIQMTPYV